MKNSVTSALFSRASLFIIAILLLVAAAPSVNAQGNSFTFTLVKQPCNNDGILIVHTGLVPPVTLTLYIGGQERMQTFNTADDTLFNYSGAPVSAYTDNYQYYGYYAGSPPFTYTGDSASAICPALGTLQTTITGGTPPFTVEWLNLNSAVVGTSNPVMLPAGSYNVLITDAAGCVYGSYGGNAYYGNFTVSNYSTINATVITAAANCTNGAAKVSNPTGGIAPYTYLWSNGAQTDSITGLMGGDYELTITDAQGCYGVQYAYVQQTVDISVNSTNSNPTCLQNNGSIMAFGSGGQNPYSYSWSGGQQTQTITGLVAGNYYVTVSDVNSCTGAGYYSLTPTTPIKVTYSTTPSSCTAATGTATLNATDGTPPYNYAWSTDPGQTGATASNLTYGFYFFNVRDATGCVQNGSVYIPPISPVTAYIYEGDATCTQSNGLASIDVVSGTAPFTFNWSNGGASQQISNISSGYYSCTITDNLHCSVTKSIGVGTSSPIHLSLLPTEASCIFSSDGKITVNATGGTEPYTYNWTSGQTTSTINGLNYGNYWVGVQDAAGCTQEGYVFLDYNHSGTGCYCTLTGMVFNDANNNCVPDQGEAGIPNIMIYCSGIGYTFTDANGYYRFTVPTGSYTLSEVVQYYYPLASCQGNSIPVNVMAAQGCITTNNFANVVNPIHDVSITTTGYTCHPLVGGVYYQRVVVTNNGTITEPGIQLGYQNDGQLAYNGVTPSIFTPGGDNWYSITSGFPSLAPAATQFFDVAYNVPSNIPLNTSVFFYDTVAYTAPISNWLVDYTPWNNVNTYQTTTVGSYDPNEKEVTPIGAGTPGYIKTTDSILSYTIHFQNTGNYAAQKVVVIDTLSPNLDITTLRPGYSNHVYTTDMSENGIVKFTFNNINLPDSNGQASASIGIVQYTIKQKPNLTGGTVITSPATIYFDYNAGVQTNATVNTIEAVTGIKDIQPKPFSFNLFPNPTAGHLRLSVQSEENAPCTMRFYNITGQLVKSEELQMNKGNNTLTTSVQLFSPGLYFVEISDGQYVSTRKVSVIE